MKEIKNEIGKIFKTTNETVLAATYVITQKLIANTKNYTSKRIQKQPLGMK